MLARLLSISEGGLAMYATRLATTFGVLLAMLAPAAAYDGDLTAMGLNEVRTAEAWPEGLDIRVRGLFQSTADGQVGLVTWTPLDDASAVDSWHLIEGAQYDYEVILRSDDGWLVRSLSVAFAAEEPATALAPVPSAALTAEGTFIAPREGRLFPQFTSEGDAERDCVVRLLLLPLPEAPPTVIHIEQTEAAPRFIYRSDPWASPTWGWQWHYTVPGERLRPPLFRTPEREYRQVRPPRRDTPRYHDGDDESRSDTPRTEPRTKTKGRLGR